MMKYIASVCVTTFTVAFACGGNEPEPKEPQAPVASVGPTVTAATTTAPATAQPPVAPTASATHTLEPALAAPAQAVLNELAKTEAPGAKPVGNPRVQLLGLNQSNELAIRLEPGKCYTVLAVGLPPVSEVNVQLLPAVAIPGTSGALAQDQTTGPQAVLGQSPNCFKWALPVATEAKVVTTVAGGTGLVGTQVYAK